MAWLGMQNKSSLKGRPRARSLLLSVRRSLLSPRWQAEKTLDDHLLLCSASSPAPPPSAPPASPPFPLSRQKVRIQPRHVAVSRSSEPDTHPSHPARALVLAAPCVLSPRPGPPSLTDFFSEPRGDTRLPSFPVLYPISSPLLFQCRTSSRVSRSSTRIVASRKSASQALPLSRLAMSRPPLPGSSCQTGG